MSTTTARRQARVWVGHALKRWAVFRVEDDNEADTLTVEINGRHVATIDRSAQPELAELLRAALPDLHAALTLAKAELQTQATRIEAGKTTGQRKRDDGAAADRGLIRKAKQILAVEGPMPKTHLAELLEERACGTFSSIQKKLSKPAIWEKIKG